MSDSCASSESILSCIKGTHITGYSLIYYGSVFRGWTKVIDGFEVDSYEAHIDLRVEAQGNLGPFEHTVLFRTDFPDHPTAKLTIHGNIVPHISVKPSELFLGLMSHEKHSERTITLRSRTNKPFMIKAIKLTTDDLAATRKAASQNQTVWEITLDFLPTLHKGILKGKIVLETDDPDAPKIEIPFTGLVAG